MSQHPSLRFDSVGTKHRNVFKRFERVKKLQEMGKWNDKSTVYNLPKVKSLKIKMKKVKEAKEGTSTEGVAAPAVGAPAATKPAAKTAAKPAGETKK
ncbi:MAG TPA: small basic protein [Candidatus Omnitrophota bacterium]|nr:small basic protein [Candidatus Omnitrophota bacterium]